MRQIWTPVRVSNSEHTRNGQTGYVSATDPKRPDVVAIRFDADGVESEELIADLAVLA